MGCGEVWYAREVARACVRAIGRADAVAHGWQNRGSPLNISSLLVVLAQAVDKLSLGLSTDQ